MSRKAGYRGQWSRLTVDFKVKIKKRKRKPSKKKIEELSLLAMLAALEGEEPPQGTRIAAIAWENPDVESKDTRHIIENPDEDWLNDDKNGLPTLNRGGWLARKLRGRLDRLRGNTE